MQSAAERRTRNANAPRSRVRARGGEGSRTARQAVPRIGGIRISEGWPAARGGGCPHLFLAARSQARYQLVTMIQRAILFVCLVISIVPLSPGAKADVAGSRPNIVFMLADDMGWAQPGFNGGDQGADAEHRPAGGRGPASSPSSTPIPSAPRPAAHFLTGRYAFRNWMDWRSEDFGKPSYLKRLGLTLAHNDTGRTDPPHPRPRYQRTHDCRSAQGGRLLHRACRQVALRRVARRTPARCSRGSCTSTGTTPGGSTTTPRPSSTTPRRGSRSTTGTATSSRLQEEGYTTDLFAAEAERVIAGQTADRPFFLYVPFNAVHGPLNEPPRYARQGYDVRERHAEVPGRRRRPHRRRDRQARVPRQHADRLHQRQRARSWRR